ncbi:MAG: gamma-glutamyl-gamma-aminobutyrate hydrolase family protein [Aestuariibacter sp.]
MKPPKILLLQIREKAQVRAEEYASFCEFSGLKPAQLDILNVFDTPQFDNTVLQGYDGLFVGGASEASVLEPHNYPFLPSCVALLKHCIAIGFPTFASCFGFQLAVQALDGEIVRDDKDFEIGTLPISLTVEAQDDALMATLPNPFFAVSVHRERATQFPENTIALAYTDACPHAFKVVNKPFWAFQFHPEVDKRILMERLSVYKTQYTDDEAHFDQIIASAVETPESNHLVRLFIEAIDWS